MNQVLIGAKSEQDVEVNVTFPKDYHASLAGKAALFKVKVHEVKGKEYPELTDELVKELEIENVNTVEEYQNYVKEDLKKRKSVAAENHLVTGLVDAVCKNSYADFPESLIKSEVEHQVNNVEMQAKQYGMPVEMLLQYSGVASMDEFKKSAEEHIRKSFLEELVLEKIMELENIEASQEEIEKEYQTLANVSEKDDEKAKNDKVNAVKKQYKVGQVAYKVKADKVIEILKKNAVTKEAKEETK